jgi:hypothetical protein
MFLIPFPIFLKKIILKLIVLLLPEFVGSMKYFSFPWPPVVPTYNLKMLAQALNRSGHFWTQEDSLFTQNLFMSIISYHSV